MNADRHDDHDTHDAGELELLGVLTNALAFPIPEPSDERVAAVRSAMQRHREETQPIPTSFAKARRAATRWPMAAAAAAVLVVALTAGFLVGRGSSDDGLLAGGGTEFEETLTAPNGPARADVTGVLTGIGRVVQIRTDELPILPKGEFYEVWFVAANDTPDAPNRISAGTFHPDEQGRTAVDLTAAVNPALFPVLSITAEPGDGNPLPTGPEVLRTDIRILD